MKSLFSFGKLSVKAITRIIFFMGLPFVFIQFGMLYKLVSNMTASTKLVMKQIGPQVHYTYEPTFNVYALLVIIFVLPLLLFIWRILCEMIYLLLNGLKSLELIANQMPCKDKQNQE